MGYKEFHERLRNLRESKKIMQIDITKEIGIPSSTYNYYENGKMQPTINAIVELADFFDVSIDYLIGRTDTNDGLVITFLPDEFYKMGIKFITLSSKRLYDEGLLERICSEYEYKKVEEFNERLRIIRLSKGFSQIEVSKATGIASSTYNYYELGRNKPTISAFSKLVEYFNVTSDFLAGRTNNPEDLILKVVPGEPNKLNKKYIVVSQKELIKDKRLKVIFNEIFETFRNGLEK